MRIIKVLTSFLVTLSLILSINFDYGSGHFIQVRAGEAWAASQLYYYYKYDVAQKLAPDTVWADPVYLTPSEEEITVSTEYVWSTEDQRFYGTGTPATYWSGGCIGYYQVLDPGLFVYKITAQDMYSRLGTIAIYQAGTLVDDNIIASDGTYPDNGEHTDGYWYIKVGPVNISPIINITLPTPNDTLNIGRLCTS